MTVSPQSAVVLIQGVPLPRYHTLILPDANSEVKRCKCGVRVELGLLVGVFWGRWITGISYRFKVESGIG